MVTFTQALKKRYVDQHVVDDILVLPKDKSITTQIVLVGFGKVSNVQKQLKELTSIDLSRCDIDSLRDFQEIGKNLHHVQILDLSYNSLDWEDIIAIKDNLPRLRELIIINAIRLSPDRMPTSQPSRNIFSLTMGCTDGNWSLIIDYLSSTWLSVEQIDLWSSQLDSDKMILKSTTIVCDKFIKGIKTLKLSQNNFPDIDWLNRIGPIENLNELDLSKCHLEKFLLDENHVKLLNNLKILNISYNNITDWTSLTNLYKLPNLKSLICHENPLFIKEKDAKLLTIGSLKQIKTINREEISDSMRRDSEVLYVRKLFPIYQQFVKGDNPNFENTHPRYQELAGIYGLPEDLTTKQVIDRYITVDLCFGNKKISKKLPRDMRVANVIMLSKKLFGLKPFNNIEILCRNSESPDRSLDYNLDKDGQTLHFFSVKSGQELIITQI